MPGDQYRLMFLDDEVAERERFARNVDEFNENADRKISIDLTVAETSNQALSILSRERIDCAIIDLRVPVEAAAGTVDGEGNNVIREICEKYPMPIVVNSGLISELEEQFEQLPILKLTKEGRSHQRALDWIEHREPFMKALSQVSDKIRRHSANVFVNSIWPRWDREGSHTMEDEEFIGVVGRQVVSYVFEQLSISHENNTDHHFNEFYLFPPIRNDRLHTGDLVRFEDELYVILTPQCNIANQYPEHFILAICRDHSGPWSELKDDLNGNRESRDSATRSVRNHAHQNVGIARHFLPPFANEGPWLVDFKHVITLPSERAPELREGRVASITAQFIPNLVQRFSSYIGRVGQPDLAVEGLKSHITS